MATSRQTSGMRQATGRDRTDWFATLDEWGAAGRPFREIADWLERDHQMSSWWAQKLIVEYEQARGLRRPGQRADGTFTVTASKSIAAPAAQVFDAFVGEERRAHWLPGVVIHERTSRPERSARFDWAADDTRVNVSLDATSDRSCRVAVEHERLPDSETAERTRSFWRERLATLKSVVEQER